MSMLMMWFFGKGPRVQELFVVHREEIIGGWERDLNRGFSQDATMFETISVPLLTSIITPLSIIFCRLATTVIFLYWREKCEKGSDMSNSLLLIVSMSNLANSIVSALVIVSIFTHSNKGTFLPCVLFNITNFCGNWSPSFSSVSSSLGGNYSLTTTSLSGNVRWREFLG